MASRIDKNKIEEWAKQQVDYTSEILWLRDSLTEAEKEIYYWRNAYIEMTNRATKWKQRFLKEKGIS